ncbi:hypothetical protein BRC81_16100 [Halobacteriales archaeon QS_1_68_20]|nr:MAG: hypothetical protein BRC81_16100 [Halobacteriales archaeon QS_1_68_20]
MASHGVIKIGWLTLLLAAGAIDTWEWDSGPGLDGDLREWYLDALLNNELPQDARDAFVERSVAGKIDQVDAPALLVQGWDDTLFKTAEALRTYRALLDDGVDSPILYLGDTKDDGYTYLEQGFWWWEDERTRFRWVASQNLDIVGAPEVTLWAYNDGPESRLFYHDDGEGDRELINDVGEAVRIEGSGYRKVTFTFPPFQRFVPEDEYFDPEISVENPFYLDSRDSDGVYVVHSSDYPSRFALPYHYVDDDLQASATAPRGRSPSATRSTLPSTAHRSATGRGPATRSSRTSTSTPPGRWSTARSGTTATSGGRPTGTRTPKASADGSPNRTSAAAPGRPNAWPRRPRRRRHQRVRSPGP